MKKKQFKIELSDEAENDFDKSYQFYANENEKIADSFYKQINNGFEKISQNPLANSKVYKEIRKHVTKKFSFVIYYQLKDLIVQVIAIFHTSRNPSIWQERSNKKEV